MEETDMKQVTTFFLIYMLVGGCSMNPVLGPSDTEISQAQQYADSLPANHPEKQKAEAHVEQLKAERAAADDRVSTVSSIAGLAIPGAGGLLGLVYGFIQRTRNKQTETALSSTMSAIEGFKKVGGDDAVAKLVNELSKSHEKAGVRTAIQKSLKEIKVKTGTA
jgi:hypothetical protein